MSKSYKSSVDDDSFKFKLNGGEYYCYFLISNNPEPPKEFTGKDLAEGVLLTKSAIVSLDIHENFFAPEIVGTITINNPFNYMEDEHLTSGDGEDYLHINFVDYETYKTGDYTSEALRYSFVITDEQNSISKTDRSNNLKTYTLVDKNFYRFNKTFPKDTKFPLTNDATPIGKVIYNEVLGPLFELSSIVASNEKGQDLNWDEGNHILNSNNGDFPFTFQSLHPGKHWRYSDVLKYLLRYNYSFTDSGLPAQTFMQFNRDNETYSLLPLDSYFKENDKFTIEALGVGDLLSEGKNQKFESINKNNPVSNTNIKFNRYTGLLHNTDLTTPYTTYTNEYFMDYKVTNNYLELGDSKETTIRINEVIGQWENDFVRNFKLAGGMAKPFIPFNKSSDRPVKPFGLPNFPEEDCINLVKAQMVSNLTFFNLQLTLDIAGDTARRPGRFIDIFKLSEQEGTSDAKLLGKWFITNVHHRFIKDKYQTVIICIKPYVGPDHNYVPRTVEEAAVLPLPWTGEADPSFMNPDISAAGSSPSY
tara:strand:- start:2335 stop:3930 length:1596 start_codon:yes stop_codon:yes gene_type:complete